MGGIEVFVNPSGVKMDIFTSFVSLVTVLY